MRPVASSTPLFSLDFPRRIRLSCKSIGYNHNCTIAPLLSPENPVIVARIALVAKGRFLAIASETVLRFGD
jgi:hypothetical protein